MKILHLLSGGLDSTILLGYLNTLKNHEIKCLTFDYGQTHKKEILAAKEISNDYNCDHKIIEANFFPGCALVGDKTLKDGPSETAIVPNRNMVFLSIAAAYAMQKNIRFISWAVVKDDADIFEDCRYDFWQKMNQALSHTKIQILAPYINKTKKEIVNQAIKKGYPFEKSWSCYRGGTKPCGKCGACILRKEAIDEAQSV